MKFTCIGFDIREWPSEGNLTVEQGYSRLDELYAKALVELKLEENGYQIIEIHNNEELNRLIDFISQYQNANLYAILYSDLVAQVSARKGCDTSLLDLNSFIDRGYDVCDWDGLYSFMDYAPKDKLNQNGLFSEENLVWALDVMQLTQFNDPGHCPVVIAKLLTLK